MKSAQDQFGTHLAFSTTIQKTVGANYLLYLPSDYEKTEREYPTILFLHGAGERGNDPDLIRLHGPMKYLTKQEKNPFIIVAPQCPNQSSWNDDVLIALLDEVCSKYRIDKDRIYLTGFSMGGFGTWALGRTHPERFAALIPICGGGFHWDISSLEDIPIWTFHGTQDTAVPIICSEKMVNALANNKKLKFTVYPGVEHDCWTETYNNPEIYEWLLQHRLSHRKPKK